MQPPLDIGPELVVLPRDEAMDAEIREVVAELEAIGDPFRPRLWPDGREEVVMPDDPCDPAQWDRYWATLMISDGHPDILRASWDALRQVTLDRMLEARVRSILVVGNGPMPEPHYLALAGFEVTALDLSPLATRFARARPFDLPRFSVYLDGEGECKTNKELAALVARYRRDGGSVRWVTGNFMDPAVLPGPFDMVLSRRAVQCQGDRFREALRRLAARVRAGGLLLEHSHNRLRDLKLMCEDLAAMGFVLFWDARMPGSWGCSWDWEGLRADWTAYLEISSG